MHIWQIEITIKAGTAAFSKVSVARLAPKASLDLGFGFGFFLLACYN